MAEYKIDKGIPIPPKGLAEIAATLEAMEIGDSALFPKKKGGYCGYTSNVKFRTGYEFVQRSVEDGVRVWRVN